MSVSAATARANALVADNLPLARELGRRLADLLDDPDGFERELERGFASLADPVYGSAQERVAPGVGAVIGVRWPLVAAVERELRPALAQASSSTAVYLADRLSRSATQEIKLFAHVPLRRSLPDDPERSWQIVRRLMRRASDWISVDSLADIVARGILLERYRWAELEQLIYSPHRWERRLVGSTVATLPFRVSPRDRAALAGSPALTVVGSLIGDAEPDVQKALSWGLRSWYRVDADGVEALLRREAARAASTCDGNRAWVVRDALSVPGMPVALASDLRAQLGGIRRRPHAPSTSSAAEAAAMLGAFPDAHTLAEAPLTR